MMIRSAAAAVVSAVVLIAGAGVVVVNSKLHNVPATIGNDWPLRTPGNARSEQFYFTK